MKIRASQLPPGVLESIENPDPLQGEDIIIEKDNGEIVGAIIQPGAYKYFSKKVEEEEDRIDAESGEKYTLQSKTPDDLSKENSSEIEQLVTAHNVEMVKRNELKEFFKPYQKDMAGFKFSREEANER